jgi:hypothetical protein
MYYCLIKRQSSSLEPGDTYGWILRRDRTARANMSGAEVSVLILDIAHGSCTGQVHERNDNYRTYLIGESIYSKLCYSMN